jgi:hypothetical protein
MHVFQTDYGANKASCTVGTGAKRQGRKAALTIIAEVKHTWFYISIPLYVFML